VTRDGPARRARRGSALEMGAPASRDRAGERPRYRQLTATNYVNTVRPRAQKRSFVFH